MDTPGYEALAAVLARAYQQAASGKGKERHASDGLPFEAQPMAAINRTLGTIDGYLYQAAKKAQEARRLPGGRAQAELLGAINYLAGAVIALDTWAACTLPAPQVAEISLGPLVGFRAACPAEGICIGGFMEATSPTFRVSSFIEAVADEVLQPWYPDSREWIEVDADAMNYPLHISTRVTVMTASERAAQTPAKLTACVGGFLWDMPSDSDARIVAYTTQPPAIA